MVHACNLTGRDQEEYSSKSAPGKKFVRPYPEKSHHKNKVGGGLVGVAQVVKAPT
jgi:hypothetical protein